MAWPGVEMVIKLPLDAGNAISTSADGANRGTTNGTRPTASRASAALPSAD